jgi:hypothetical protein
MCVQTAVEHCSAIGLGTLFIAMPATYIFSSTIPMDFITISGNKHTPVIPGNRLLEE